MKLRHSLPALTLTVAMAFVGQPVLAQSRGGGSRGGSHGGGSHGGGSHGGGSYAVPRGSGGGSGGGAHYGSRPGYAPRGGVAEQRHPRAGTGYRYGYGHGYYSGYGRYYGGYGYRPYYGYGYGYGYGYPYSSYYPYYWPGVSLSFGLGYGSSEPYYGGGYYGSPTYSVGASAPYVAESGEDSGAAPPPARESEGSYAGRSSGGPSGRVRLEVRPEDTSVYVDDAFHGTAREARIMNLPPGRHRIELVRPGFATDHREVTVVTGESQDVLVELLRP